MTSSRFEINLPNFFKGMSGSETVHYVHFMNWVRQLPGTDIRDYDRSNMKGVVKTCLEVIYIEIESYFCRLLAAECGLIIKFVIFFDVLLTFLFSKVC